MAAENKPDQEPSIEEILASIRQIISDDEDSDDAPVEQPAAAAPPPSAPEPFAAEPEEEDEDDDILDLTPAMAQTTAPEPVQHFEIDLQEIEEEPSPEPASIDFTPPPAPQPKPEPIPEFRAAPTPTPPSQPPVQAASVKREEAPASHASVDDILSESARNATISSMAKLAGNMPITRHREYGNITLEDLVREMLHPMLRDWLSDNLPPMVERVVQRELEKLARQSQDV